jgi:hypothetical protein
VLRGDAAGHRHGADVPALHRRLLPGQGPQVDRSRPPHLRCVNNLIQNSWFQLFHTFWIQCGSFKQSPPDLTLELVFHNWIRIQQDPWIRIQPVQSCSRNGKNEEI